MLDLRFSAFAGRVEVSSDALRATQLQELRGRFPSGTTVSVVAFELDLDDLLVNLRELARWPADDADIRWQPELLTLVETNDRDVQSLRSDLLPSGPAVSGASPALATQWDSLLTDFQRRDLNRLLGLSHGANFSVPGAGKTRVALALFDSKRREGAVSQMFVVAPKSAFESWFDEISECFSDGAVRVAAMDGRQVPSADIVLVNYERITDTRSAVIHWMLLRPTLLVLDEAHRMKLGAAGIWGATCLSLGPYAKARLILSGTPAPNGVKDLENLFGFVWPGLGRQAVQNATSGRDLRDASSALRPLFVRTTKKELSLPPVTVVVRRIDLPPLHRELYAALLGTASMRFGRPDDDIEKLGQVLLYLLMAATTPALRSMGSSKYEPLPYRIPPLEVPPHSSLAALMRDLPLYETSPKYLEVASIVAQNASVGRKTIVWSTFVRNLTSLATTLDAFRPAVVHGGTPDRAEQLTRFRHDPTCSVLLTNPATLGEGVSLHHVCHDAVYLDRDFAAGRFLQSVDRIHRLGLPRDTETRVTVLAASNTIDEIVEQRLAAKLRFMGTVLDDPAVLELGDLNEEPTTTGGMDASDVAALVAHLSQRAAS